MKIELERIRYAVIDTTDLTNDDWVLINSSGVNYSDNTARKSTDGSKTVIFFDYYAALANPVAIARLSETGASIMTKQELKDYLSDPNNGFD